MTPTKGTSLLITFRSCKKQTGDAQFDVFFPLVKQLQFLRLLPFRFRALFRLGVLCQPLTPPEGFYFTSHRLQISGRTHAFPPMSSIFFKALTTKVICFRSPIFITALRDAVI